MKIYLAGRISGSTPEEVFGYFNGTKAVLRDLYGYEVLTPMMGKEYLRTEKKFAPEGYKYPVSTDHAIVERDRWMVSQADIVYVNLMDTEHVSIGCMMELAWASILGKHTIIAFEKDNIHYHAFVLEAADIVFNSTEEAMQYLKDISEAMRSEGSNGQLYLGKHKA